MTPSEEWRPVVGYEAAYEVSSLGRVRSLDRRVGAGGGRTRLSGGRVLSPYAGDHYVKVRLKVDGAGSTKNVHSLVAAAFLGPRPDGTEVCHINGDGHDNRASNLRYDTHRANSLDRTAHGVDHYARRTHCDRGHPYNDANTYVRPGGARMCRTCNRTAWRRRST